MTIGVPTKLIASMSTHFATLRAGYGANLTNISPFKAPMANIKYTMCVYAVVFVVSTRVYRRVIKRNVSLLKVIPFSIPASNQYIYYYISSAFIEPYIHTNGWRLSYW